MTAYAWIIDNEVPNVTGSRNAPVSLLSRLEKGEGERFRMLDDDEELVYEGRILFDGEPEGEDEFAPLDSYGMPNAGCTIIQYRNKAGEWESL